MTSFMRTRGGEDDDIKLNRMIFISLVLHFIVLSIIFFAPRLPSPKWTFGPIHSVHLVSYSEIFRDKEVTSDIQRDIKGPGLDGRPLALKKNTDAVSPAPIRRIDVPKKRLSGVERAIEDIREKVLSSVQPSSQPDETEMRAPVREYYAVVWSRIKGQWALPQNLLPREDINAVIHVRILRSGAVKDLSFEKRSGNRFFDDSALRAVKKASPFPPLPELIKESSIEIGIRFHASEFR